MKKVKIMLMLIAMFAVVGGALAFKVRKFNVMYCISLTYTGVHPFGLVGKKTDVAPSLRYYYTPTINMVNCPNLTTLISTSTFFTDNEM